MKNEKSINGNELLLSFIISVLDIINNEINSITIDLGNKINEFDLNFFDDDANFYKKILSHLYGIEKNKVLTNIQSSSKLFLRNLIVFLKYLQEIVNTNKFKPVYKDPIVKIDISLIIGYLSNKYGKDTVESVEFFWICIKELERKYNIPYNNYSSNYDNEIKSEAEYEINRLIFRKKTNFVTMLEFLKQHFADSDLYEDLKEVNKIYKEYLKDSKNLSLNELGIQYFNNVKYKDYIDTYLDKILTFNGYNKKNFKDEVYKKKKEQMKNNLFFSYILTIDLNNIDNCIFILYLC